MALFCSPCKCPKLWIRFHINSSNPKPLVSETLPSTISISKSSKISISTVPNLLNLTLERPQCFMSSSSIESDKSPSTIIFIKGLPQSTSEKSLSTAFSQFGEVSRVKIITDKKTRRSLGFAYIWFTSEECAQTAVKEMNGKFFDGRYVFVTIAQPGCCKTQVKPTPYKF